ENFGAGFESICRAIATLSRQFPQVEFVYPVHLNPNVREPVQRILGVLPPSPHRGGGAGGEGAAPEGDGMTNIHLIEPLAYLPFIALMDRATILLTDSGGIQEEAPSLGK